MAANCGGLILIDVDKIVLVKGKNGNYSFPKGKYEKKDADIYECARREFIEESGYTDFSYCVDLNHPLFGHSAKGTKSIVYFVCHVIEKFSTFRQQLLDPDEEIEESGFFTLPEILALETLKEDRKQLARDALERSPGDHTDSIVDLSPQSSLDYQMLLSEELLSCKPKKKKK